MFFRKIENVPKIIGDKIGPTIFAIMFAIYSKHEAVKTDKTNTKTKEKAKPIIIFFIF